jgi:hypothetical protein
MRTRMVPWRWIDPLEEPSWDRWVLRHDGATAFHTRAWAQVLRDAYGYRLAYGVHDEPEDAPSLLPVAEVASLLTGRRGAALPFTDSCPPLLNEGVDRNALAAELAEVGRTRRWRYVELRGGEALPWPFTPTVRFVEHRLVLEVCGEAQRAKLAAPHRRNLAKAEAAGLEVELTTSLRAVATYYDLHCRTRRRHGLPPQPPRFFRAIHEHLVARGSGMVVLARLGGTPIGGALFLHAGREAVYKYAASDPEAWPHAPNFLVVWSAIEHYRARGFKTLSFGRSDATAEGLQRFKKKWGAEARDVVYHRAALVGSERSAQPSTPKGDGFAKAVVRRLPVPVLQLCGRLMYRHVG